MNELLLITISLLFVYLISKHDFFNPATAYCGVAFCSAWVFYVCSILGYRPARVERAIMFNSDYSAVSVELLSLLTVQAAVAIAAFTLARKTAGQNSDVEALRLRINTSAILVSADRLFRNGFTSIVISCVLSVLFLACLAHLVVYTPGRFWNYSGYLQTRSAENAGITNPVMAVFHQSLPELGFLLILAGAYCCVRKHLLMLSLAMLPALYAFAFSASLGSRASAAQLGAAGVILVLSHGGYRVVGSMFMVAAGFLYNGLLLLRLNSGTYGRYGLSPLLATFGSRDFFKPDVAIFFFFNLFSGGCNLAHAMVRAPQTFPLPYKILSFSPAPNFLDGFQRIRVMSEIRIDPSHPYGFYSELYLFGPGWFIGYQLFIFVVLYGFCCFWERSRGLFGALMLFAVYAHFVISPSYPIRNSFRLLILPCFLILIASRWNRARGPSLRIVETVSEIPEG